MVYNNMEQSNSLIDPQDEVKKLQDLVKKLEKQNELLRSKQKLQTIDSHLSNGDPDNKPVVTKHTESNDKSKLTKDCLKGLDEVEIVNVDELSLKNEEDESWLYSSPKAPTPQQTKVSPYKWVRQEFDHPSPELISGRKSLLSKMDEVARMNRSCSTPTLGSSQPNSQSSPLSRSTENTTPYGMHPLSRKSLLASLGGGRVDTGTFTRPRKNKDRSRLHSTEKENDYRDDRIPAVSDIEAVAKLQEESLRQSITHHPSPRRGLNRKGFGFLGASDAENSGSPIGSARSSPARFDDSGVLERYRNSIDSDGSSPPDSPHAAQHSYNYENGGKRSLPSMSRIQQYSSDSSLDHQSVGSDDANLAPETRPVTRLQQPSIRAPSPGFGLKQPNSGLRRAVSPARSGLPQPMMRRTIPRPNAGRSSLPSPRRSNIPSPRPNVNSEAADSWREGCF
ncbi:SLAIN motif-containing protein 2 isoform X2 [Patella vulgata]|uniref:SLAIN motif-containing protein 2 isoform X2 n=1 Tax=Patella vulgata TaxID=6465 RepID=UPI00217FE7E9|nr:SLAIN motif-containing protein 2 isoform X2 [Patella vulgata]